MKAFVEILSGLIRIGPDAEKYGDPFDFSIAFSASANVAALKGTSIPKVRSIHPDGSIVEKHRYTFSEAREIYRVVHEALREFGLEATHVHLHGK